MLDFSHIPVNTKVDQQTFYPNSVSGGTAWYTWIKPRGVNFVQFIVLGGGTGGGSSGATAATALVGGTGGVGSFGCGGGGGGGCISGGTPVTPLSGAGGAGGPGLVIVTAW
jgi:hypothetical protein